MLQWWSYCMAVIRKQKLEVRNVTSEEVVELNSVWSKIQPCWHGTVPFARLRLLLSGSSKALQELKEPSSSWGILRASTPGSVSQLLPFLSSGLPREQRWGGVAEMKLCSRKWRGRMARGKHRMLRRRNWNLLKPPISSRISSNLIVTRWRLICCFSNNLQHNLIPPCS